MWDICLAMLDDLEMLNLVIKHNSTDEEWIKSRTIRLLESVFQKLNKLKNVKIVLFGPNDDDKSTERMFCAAKKHKCIKYPDLTLSIYNQSGAL